MFNPPHHNITTEFNPIFFVLMISCCCSSSFVMNDECDGDVINSLVTLLDEIPFR
jgi:hypothetical protein